MKTTHKIHALVWWQDDEVLSKINTHRSFSKTCKYCLKLCGMFGPTPPVDRKKIPATPLSLDEPESRGPRRHAAPALSVPLSRWLAALRCDSPSGRPVKDRSHRRRTQNKDAGRLSVNLCPVLLAGESSRAMLASARLDSLVYYRIIV